MRHEAGCAVVMAAKQGCTSSLLLLEHSAGGEELGECAVLPGMRQTDSGEFVRVKGGGVGSMGASRIYSSELMKGRVVLVPAAVR
jgi:hypothetical protein